MTTFTTTSYRFPALQGSDDFASWKIYITDCLTEQGFDDHIDPGVTLPTDPAELAAWKKADRHAFSAIRLRVSPDIVHHVQGESTALEAWSAL
ncbi:hypothetical protein R3P38DRAFT_2477811, partial [Favolaschia claudopus]